MKPIKHHPLVVNALISDVIGHIECSSQEHMEEVFTSIVSHYNAKVIVSLGRPVSAFLWPIKGKKSRSAREYNLSHHVISVKKHMGITSNGVEFWRVLLKPVSGYKNAAELKAACID
jgi:hypothetical protein